MANSADKDPLQLHRLTLYSACDVSDALLRLQKPVDGEVSRAGYLVDLVPFGLGGPCTDGFKERAKVIGPASTVKLVSKGSTSVPLGELHPGTIAEGQHWVDLTDEGHIVVIEQPQEQSCAAIGGIMALRMRARSVKACVVGGRVRDLEELESSGLSIWARGRSTVGMGAEAKASARNVEICVGGVKISPGDIVFCDPVQGVVVIPRVLLEDVIAVLPELVAIDDRVKAAVLQGSSVAHAFKKHRG